MGEEPGMRCALVEPFAGIAGDMTVGALLDLGFPLEELRKGLAGLPLSGYGISAERVVRGAFRGTRFLVRVEEDPPHRHLSQVREILARGGLPPRVRERAERAFVRLAEAEARAHGTGPEEVHFHEVGAVDAVVDIVGAALGLEYFGVEEVRFTRIRLGTGEVECAHGRIPVPAPGTLELVRDLPVLLAEGEGETTTPTGAALLAAWGSPVGEALAFRPGPCGYGAGSREGTTLPNLLRVTLGETGGEAADDEVWELAANLDDQSPEGAAHAVERLLEEGALDAWLGPVVMKKGRPGVVLHALAPWPRVRELERTIFAETTTFGVRRSRHPRTVLARERVEVSTPYGTVRVKVGRLGGRTMSRSPEFEDCARRAREHGVPLPEVYAAALSALPVDLLAEDAESLPEDVRGTPEPDPEA